MPAFEIILLAVGIALPGAYLYWVFGYKKMKDSDILGCTTGLLPMNIIMSYIILFFSVIITIFEILT